MKIYYAHHVWKYGTPIEDYEIECIKKQFENAEIINPRTSLPQDSSESEILRAEANGGSHHGICWGKTN